MIFTLVLLDQIVKYFVYNTKPSVSIIGDIFEIQYIENTGTIFGLFENSNYIFMALAIVLCIFIVLYISKNLEKNSLKEKIFMLILAGGIGNLIDRVFRGFVIDFISVKWIGIFNFSDMYIVIGVILIILLELKEWKLKNEIEK